MKDILSDAREEALYNILGKALNEYIGKNTLPPYRLLRILINLQVQIISRVENHV